MSRWPQTAEVRWTCGAVRSVPPPPSPSHLGVEGVGRRQLEAGQESGHPREGVQGHSFGAVCVARAQKAWNCPELLGAGRSCFEAPSTTSVLSIAGPMRAASSPCPAWGQAQSHKYATGTQTLHHAAPLPRTQGPGQSRQATAPDPSSLLRQVPGRADRDFTGHPGV